MNSLTNFALKTKYEQVKKLRPKLNSIKNLIDWDAFLTLFDENHQVGRGRPPYDKILMVKVLFLQACYPCSDEEMEYQLYNRLDFQEFLDFPKEIPDYSTIWRFREELVESDILDKIWYELQRQLDSHFIKIEEGSYIQDAKFIHADPGKTNSGMNGRGREAKTSRSKDGSWTKKGKKSIFGFKLHTKVQIGCKFIRAVGLSTAKTHDGAIDLAKPDEIIYRDKGYTGINTKAKGNATMKRGKLSARDELRNERITKKRCQGEHPFGTMARSFKAGYTKLTTIPRVFVQQIFVCMAYNISRLEYLLS